MRFSPRTLALVLGCLALCGIRALAKESPPVAIARPAVAPVVSPQPESWIEVTPLGSFEPARLFLAVDSSAPVRLDHWMAGLALVCFGGKDKAVECEQRYLDASPGLSPELRKGARVTGLVLIGSTPVRDARVALVPKRLVSRRLLTLPLALDRRTKTLVREVRTDGTGRFRTPQLAPAEYQLEINAPGGLILHGEPFEVPPPEALIPKGASPGSEAVLDLGRIVLPDGLRVEMLVHDAAGVPIAGAKVGGGQGERPESRRFFETVTDGQGKAVLSGLDPAQASSFVCVAPGYSDVRLRLVALPLSVECTMNRLALLEGRVDDGDGKPVAGAMVSLAPGKRSVPAGKDGAFSFGDLGPGSYRLVAAAPGFKPERMSFELTAGDRRKLPTIALRPGREIRGFVRDGGSKEPLAGAALSSVDPPGAVATETAEDGSFQLSTDDTEPMAVEVSAAGYPAKTAELPRGAEGQRAPWVIELTPGGRIRAEVWDEEADGPCQGCALTIAPSGGAVQSVTTDGEGVAVSKPLAEGTYMVSPVKVQSLGWVVQVSSGRDVKPVQVVAGETAAVHFGERRRVVVRLHPQVPGWALMTRAGPRSGAADPLPDGSFQVAKPPGEAVSLILVRGRENVALGVLPREDDRLTFDIDIPQTEVRGVLVGKDLPVSVRLSSASDPGMYAISEVPPDGTFTIPFLAPGIYDLSVTGRSVRSLSVATSGSTDLGRIDLR